MEVLVIASLLGLIPAFIAKSKGRSMGAWWVYGTLLFIIALAHSIFMSDHSKRPVPHQRPPEPETYETCKKCGHIQYSHLRLCKNCRYDKKVDPELLYTDERNCPFCAEPIKKKAIKCKHCGSEVEPIPDPKPVGPQNWDTLLKKKGSTSKRVAITPSGPQPPAPPTSHKGKIFFWSITAIFIISMIAYGTMQGDKPHIARKTADQISFERIQKQIHDHFKQNKPEIIAKAKARLSQDRPYEVMSSTSKYVRLKDQDIITLRHQAQMKIDYIPVKRLPASDIKGNMEGYAKLANAYPENKVFKRKLAHYREKYNKTKK